VVQYKYNSAHGTGVFKRHKEKHDKKSDQILIEHRTKMVQTQFGTGGTQLPSLHVGLTQDNC
jgi:hypothetical protein